MTLILIGLGFCLGCIVTVCGLVFIPDSKARIRLMQELTDSETQRIEAQRKLTQYQTLAHEFTTTVAKKVSAL